MGGTNRVLTWIIWVQGRPDSRRIFLPKRQSEWSYPFHCQLLLYFAFSLQKKLFIWPIFGICLKFISVSAKEHSQWSKGTETADLYLYQHAKTYFWKRALWCAQVWCSEKWSRWHLLESWQAAADSARHEEPTQTWEKVAKVGKRVKGSRVKPLQALPRQWIAHLESSHGTNLWLKRVLQHTDTAHSPRGQAEPISHPVREGISFSSLCSGLTPQRSVKSWRREGSSAFWQSLMLFRVLFPVPYIY